ncbi:MAG: Tex family protein [Desulfobacterales bacterium]|nr:Tex family protein [Desulfobacterales bacterium]
METDRFIAAISEELTLNPGQVEAAASLLESGATIPFIARYRKEATGSLDEVAVTAIRDRLNQLKELSDRKETVLKSLEKNGHLTDELKQKVLAADSLATLEDLYLPYKPKRRTKGVIAREKGLEPLATALFEQTGKDPQAAADPFIDPEKGFNTIDEALSGARDIIAETVNENEDARAALREIFFTKGIIKSWVAADMAEKGAKYRDYFDWEEPLTAIPSHRMLAIRRGETEDILHFRIQPDADQATALLESLFVKGDGPDAEQVRQAVKDAYKRLLSNSMETEARIRAKKTADTEAIRIFAENLRQLLLAPPLGTKRVMGIDPGFRTGCKVVCLDAQGKLLLTDTIYPHMSEKQRAAERDKIKSLCETYQIEAVAVGNGTAGRETEAFVKAIEFSPPPQVVMVNESGASVYSASEVAREEFPNHDLTVRGAVSIGRRLMDPLAELVKIDAKSIGVGQYQHDVDQKALKQALDDVVMSCVNAVGVDLNRASAQLLTYVSGLNAAIAKNIVAYREENGPFASRQALMKVSRLGPKAFEQCAGFLRIPDGDNPLDASAVHPESYPIVDQMAADLGAAVKDLMHSQNLRERIDISAYVTDAVGLPTLRDIMAELAKPGRDPREKFEAFSFAEGVETLDDLKPGMRLPGIVTNITAFGAFVDIGVHQDGLVHISQMADRYVKNPADIVSVHQKVQVTIIDIDRPRNRISLSMKTDAGLSPAPDRGNTEKTEKPRKSRPQKKPKTNKPETFNNPFADAFRKKGLK